MGDKSAIEWTDATWNPTVGCSIVSKGCSNCYAMRQAWRLEHAFRHPAYAGTTTKVKGIPLWTGTVNLAEDNTLALPLRWKRPRRIFVNSMSDLFHESLEDWQIAQVFAVMSVATQHTYQVLTKRPERMRAFLSDNAFWAQVDAFADELATEHTDVLNRRTDDYRAIAAEGSASRPLANVWLGASIEDQDTADARTPQLLATPAARRFVSAEPLLGPLDLTFIEATMAESRALGIKIDALKPPRGLNWVIAGGESGPDARPTHHTWIRALRDQCSAAGVPFFFKQWGAWAPVSAMTDDQVNACYRSNRRAADGENQSALDELYGRTCTVECIVLHADGSQHDPSSPGAFVQGSAAMTMFRTGKKDAGAALDGREHREWPR